MISTRADLDALSGTQAHDEFIACLAGSLWRLERDLVGQGWVVVPDDSVISRFGFSRADFPLATPPQIPAAAPFSPDELQAAIVSAVQERLDAFAATRNYDGILSACTYATSAITKFRLEGEYCVAVRDATWDQLYQILAEVHAGTRPVPEGLADVLDELPALEWPQ